MIYIIILLILIILVCLLIYNNNSEYFTSFDYTIPKTVYCYFHDLDKNPLIKAHIETWKRNISPEWQIIVLNNNNVKDYVDKDFLKKYQHLDPTRFSDFLRLYLLIYRGGVWLDSAIIIIDGKFLDEYYNEMILNRYDACLYELKSNTLNENVPHLENWFIMAPKNSKLLIDLYQEFDKSFMMGFINYKKNILVPSGINLKNTLGKDPNYTYLMQHAIINYFYHQGRKYSVNIKDAEESMFKIHLDKKWDACAIIDFILKNKDWKGYYGIKLIKSNRRCIKDVDEFIKKLDSF